MFMLNAICSDLLSNTLWLSFSEDNPIEFGTNFLKAIDKHTFDMICCFQPRGKSAFLQRKDMRVERIGIGDT